MANINDYLIWRGDLKINKDILYNKVDIIILSRCSYLWLNIIKIYDNKII